MVELASIYFTFFLKFKKQGKYQNPHDEHILKLYLSFIFGKKLTEIFKFKDKQDGAASESSSNRQGIVRIFSFS